METHKYISKAPPTIMFLAGTGLSILIFFIDYEIVGPEVTFSLLYLIPILLTVWFCGIVPGLFIILLSTIEWSYIQLHNIQYPSILYFILNLSSKFAIFMFIALLVHKLKIRITTEKIRATSDSLTGAVNRNGIYELLENEIYRAQRLSSLISLAYIDIDNFKLVNDNLGHHAGDTVLKHFTHMITRIIRKTDILGRIGGDEFIIILPETNGKAARIIIKKIKKEFSLISKRNGWPTSLSIGVGVFSGKSLDSTKMISAADALMYQVKSESKNGAVFYEYK